MKKYDYLIVGAGFAGSVMAERLASQLGKKVLIVEKRHHIAGNAYDEFDEHGILIHRYGPHIFHTNSQKVFDYLSQFTEWRFYEHKVLANLNGNLYPIPINRTTINKLYDKNFTEENEVREFYDRIREKRYPINNSEDIIVNQVGVDLYEKFFKYYVGGKLFYHARINKEQDGGLDIVTDEAFEDFELKLQWKISEYGNSGIFYTVQEIPHYDEGWKSSPEMQVLHDQGQKDGMIRSHRSGDLYDLIPCSERRTKGANEWNSIKIVKKQGKVEHWMNGKKVLEYDLNSENWKTMIASSKIAPYIDNFGSKTPFFISLNKSKIHELKIENFAIIQIF